MPSLLFRGCVELIGRMLSCRNSVLSLILFCEFREMSEMMFVWVYKPPADCMIEELRAPCGGGSCRCVLNEGPRDGYKLHRPKQINTYKHYSCSI